MTSTQKRIEVKLENADIAPAFVLTCPKETLSYASLFGTQTTRDKAKLVKRAQHLGWAKVITTNQFIAYAEIDPSIKSDTVHNTDIGIVHFEVPHTMCSILFNTVNVDKVLENNNFTTTTDPETQEEIKIPYLPSYLFASKRTYAKWRTEVAHWWRRQRSNILENKRMMKHNRAYGLFCRYAKGYDALEDGLRWFNQIIQRYELDVKSGADPMASYKKIYNFNPSKRSDYVAPAQPRVLDVIKDEIAEKISARKALYEQNKKDNEENGSDDESESEEEEKPAKKTDKKPISKKDDSESEEEEEAPKKDKKDKKEKKEKKAAKKDDSDDEEEEETKPVSKKTLPEKKAVRRNFDESDSDDDDEVPAPKAKSKTVSAAKKPVVARRNFDESDSDSDDDVPTPAPKAVATKTKSVIVGKGGVKRKNFDDSDSDSDDEEVKKPVKKSKK